MKRLLSIFFFILFGLAYTPTRVNAQKVERRMIQFSGVITSGKDPVPFVTVIIKGTNKGALTDFNGFFSFAARVKDTISISALGFKKARLVIPDTLKGNSYSRIKNIEPDTILLKTAVIYPWTIGQFKQMLLTKKIPEDDLDRAQKNLARAELKERFIATPMDGSMNFKNYMNQRADKLYYAGQYPPNRLLDPFAWARFIKAWQNGELKIQPPKDDND